MCPKRQLIRISCANLKEQVTIEKYMTKCLYGNIYTLKSTNIDNLFKYTIELDINLEKSEYYDSSDIYSFLCNFYILKYNVRYFDSNNERNATCVKDCICYSCVLK